MIYQLATIVYGTLTLILTFLLAWHVGSFWAMACSAVAAACTYVFQALLLELDATDNTSRQLLGFMWAAVVFVTLIAWVLIYVSR